VELPIRTQLYKKEKDMGHRQSPGDTTMVTGYGVFLGEQGRLM